MYSVLRTSSVTRIDEGAGRVAVLVKSAPCLRERGCTFNFYFAFVRVSDDGQSHRWTLGYRGTSS